MSKREDDGYCSFYVGQKVVCVDASQAPPFPGVEWVPIPLVPKAIYTIRDFAEHSITKNPGVLLVEIYREVLDKDLYEQPFHIARFRPVTDISIFEEMLKRAPMDGEQKLRELEAL